MILPRLVAVASDIESIVLVISCSGLLAVWLVGWLVVALCWEKPAAHVGRRLRRGERDVGVDSGWHHVQWRVCDVSL